LRLLRPALRASPSRRPAKRGARQNLYARVEQYVKLQKNVEASLPALHPTNDVARIAAHQHALARKIAQARSGARRGDIFTSGVTRQFRRIIRGEFQGPEAEDARRTIRQDDPTRVVRRLHVNALRRTSVDDHAADFVE
jgi:hypothetical protein